MCRVGRAARELGDKCETLSHWNCVCGMTGIADLRGARTAPARRFSPLSPGTEQQSVTDTYLSPLPEAALKAWSALFQRVFVQQLRPASGSFLCA